jgi:hypothetical protein
LPRLAADKVRGRHRIPVIRHTGQRRTGWDRGDTRLQRALTGPAAR